MSRMPPTVVLAVALSALLVAEAIAALLWLAATASGRGADAAIGFGACVLVAVHAARFVGGALRRSAQAREVARRRSLGVAALAAALVAVRAGLDPESISRETIVAVVAGLVAPLTVIGLLLFLPAARAWFAAPPERAP